MAAYNRGVAGGFKASWKKISVQPRNPRPRQPQAADQVAPLEPSPEMRVWQVVSMIPKGKVATYGQVAALAGMPAHARFVGAVLRRLPPGSRLPWHRVVNAGLRSSLGGEGGAEQRKRLADEGVSFIGQKAAKTCRWTP